MSLHWRRNFDAIACSWLTVRHWGNQELRSVVDLRTWDNHYDRAILQPFFLALFRFVCPQISIADDVSWLGRLP